jgi:hypothetical protein
MLRTFVKNNILLISIIVFLFIFGGLQMVKPVFLYKVDGTIREFGIGYKNKTILPVWLLSIILGILSYVGVLYYVSNIRLY